MKIWKVSKKIQKFEFKLIIIMKLKLIFLDLDSNETRYTKIVKYN